MPNNLNHITMASGWLWFCSGFSRYQRNPILMTSWTISYWSILGLVGLVPLISDFLVAGLSPILLTAILAGFRDIEKKEIEIFSIAFVIRKHRPEYLAILGILHFLVTFLALSVSSIADGGAWLKFISDRVIFHTTMNSQIISQESISWVAVLISLITCLPVMLAFSYAPLLVAWRNFSIGKALFFSLIASWRSILGLLGLILIAILSGVLIPLVITIILLMIGVSESWINKLIAIPILAVLAPIMLSAFLSSYTDILPEEKHESLQKDI